MNTSSRTPEGTPNRCPVCAHEVMVEPSIPFGDAPCPACGTLLWFVQRPSETLFRELDTADAVVRRKRIRFAGVFAKAFAKRNRVSIRVAFGRPEFLELMEQHEASLETIELVKDIVNS